MDQLAWDHFLSVFFFFFKAERITAVHCAKVVTGPTAGGTSGKDRLLVAFHRCKSCTANVIFCLACSLELTPHFASLRKAIAMLNSRVELLARYLKDAQSGFFKSPFLLMRDEVISMWHMQGAIPKDHAVLREIKGLCQRLPVMDLDGFQGNLDKVTVVFFFPRHRRYLLFLL